VILLSLPQILLGLRKKGMKTKEGLP